MKKDKTISYTRMMKLVSKKFKQPKATGAATGLLKRKRKKKKKTFREAVSTG